jgi:hypothetical protein
MAFRANSSLFPTGIRYLPHQPLALTPLPEPLGRNLRKRYHDGTTLQLVLGG